MAGLMALCTACGAFGSECVRLLRSPFAGSLGHRAFSVRAVSSGRHPVCRASRVERVWDAAGLPAGPPDPVPGAAGPPPPPPARDIPPDHGEPAPPALGPALGEAVGDERSRADLLDWHGDPPGG